MEGNQELENNLVMSIGCDPTVAKYSLLMTGYINLERATDFLFEDDENGKR